MSEPSKGFKKAFDDAAARGENRCPVCLSNAHGKEYHENAAQAPQQAGVSALLKLWLDCFDDGGVVVNENRKESWYETNVVQPTRAALATAPPEQARCSVVLTKEVDCCAAEAGHEGAHELDLTAAEPPQPVSAGALDALVAKWREPQRLAAKFGTTFQDARTHCADELEAVLAAHDQKVRGKGE